MKKIPVYLERGSKRTFACAVDWPGWCRSGRDEGSALHALLDYAPRYARAMKRKRIAFPKVVDVSALQVVETHQGNATTDFGAPDAVAKADARPATTADVRTLGAILDACWREFDAAVVSARGKALAKGPRGGGRALDAIVRHVIEADAGYIGALGGKYKSDEVTSSDRLESVRQAFLDAVAARARGEVPDRGPRGGKRWLPRFAVRRSAWHWLDHAWEIEDRAR